MKQELNRSYYKVVDKYLGIKLYTKRYPTYISNKSEKKSN